MFQIDLMSRTPIYEQLIEQTEKFILADVLKPLDKLPSVRSLSAKLSVNPNTIQRAYTQMCDRGILVSMAGKGCYVTKNAKDIIRADAAKKFDTLDELIKELIMAGISKEEIEEHVQKLLEEEK